MKKVYLILAAAVGMTITSCTTNDYLGDVNNDQAINDGSIQFGLKMQNMTRAGELIGATAADKLGGMFVVEGTKGSEQTNSPSTTVVFDNYLVGYEYNSAGTTASNTHNWEYVGKQTGITDRMTAATWTALHGAGTAQAQTIKYWDYSQDQYDFIAWSTGKCEAIPVPDPEAEPASGKVQVTRIKTGTDLASEGFTLTASSADDLMECYYTDINTVEKANYNKPVTLTFKNLAAKVRVALYETIPGYSVKEVKFYNSDAAPLAPTDLGTGSTADHAYLFTMGEDRLPQSGKVLVSYPRIGTGNKGTAPGYADRAKDYNKASVTVTPGTAKATYQEFGALSAQYTGKESNEAAGNIYLGRSVITATFAGNKGKDFYVPVIPNTNGKPLTLRVDFTLVSTDGSGEEIHVYGAKAVVPSAYTEWQPNYAYTYIFKISDNSNGYTSTLNSDPNKLYPITFDAVVANFTESNAEQTTITTVATPSITTYQQGHDVMAPDPKYDEYSKSQKAGVSAEVKDVYVQVMDNSGAEPTLKNDLNVAKKSLLFKVTTTGTTISEATVMDALENRTNLFSDVSPVGRNGITLTQNTHIANDVETIINGVDDQPITVTQYTTAKIDIDHSDVTTGTYAYVYSSTVPNKDDHVYHIVSTTEATTNYNKYYEVNLTVSDGETGKLASGTAAADKVYFVKNLDEEGKFVSYTFKQTKIGEDVTGLVEGTITYGTKATAHNDDTSTNKYFYFDVYNKNNGSYAVKLIKVVD